MNALDAVAFARPLIANPCMHTVANAERRPKCYAQHRRGKRAFPRLQSWSQSLIGMRCHQIVDIARNGRAMTDES